MVITGLLFMFIMSLQLKQHLKVQQVSVFACCYIHGAIISCIPKSKQKSKVNRSVPSWFLAKMVYKFESLILSCLDETKKNRKGMTGTKALIDRIGNNATTAPDLSLIGAMRHTNLYMCIFAEETWIHIITPVATKRFLPVKELFKLSMSK